MRKREELWGQECNTSISRQACAEWIITLFSIPYILYTVKQDGRLALCLQQRFLTWYKHWHKHKKDKRFVLPTIVLSVGSAVGTLGLLRSRFWGCHATFTQALRDIQKTAAKETKVPCAYANVKVVSIHATNNSNVYGCVCVCAEIVMKTRLKV